MTVSTLSVCVEGGGRGDMTVSTLSVCAKCFGN